MKNILIDHMILDNGVPLLENACIGLTHKQKIIVESIYIEVTTILEAELSADQVKKLFTNIEDNLTATGSNRTLAGKAVDVSSTANKIIDRIGSYLQDTTPVKFFDQKFEQLKTKVSEKFPNLDNYLTKLGAWAKENPGKTAAVVGILTALAAISTGPVGGAIAGQVLRGAVELMKGEKLSTAIGKGVKTAALGYLSAQAFGFLGDWIAGFREKVIPFGPKDAGLERVSWGAKSTMKGYGFEYTRQTQGFDALVRKEDAQLIRTALAGIKNGNSNSFDDLYALAKEIGSKTYKDGINKEVAGAWQAAKDNDSLLNFIIAVKKGIQATAQGAAAAMGQTKPQAKTESMNTTNQLALFELLASAHNHAIREGVIDRIKTLGKNITTNITATKLLKAWEKAGKPTDSYKLAKWLETQGLNKATIKSAIDILGVDHDEEVEDLRQSISSLPNDKLKELLKYIDSLIEPKAEEPTAAVSQSAAQDFASAIAKGDIQAAKKAIGDSSKLDNETKTKIRSSIENSKLPLYYKRVLLKDLGKNIGYWMKEDRFREICKILIEHNMTWKTLGIANVYRNTATKHVALFEYASGGSTSSGNVASIANPGGAMMPVIRRMPAGQSFFAPQHAGTKKPKKRTKKK
jgi:hypothetical protein